MVRCVALGWGYGVYCGADPVVDADMTLCLDLKNQYGKIKGI